MQWSGGEDGLGACRVVVVVVGVSTDTESSRHSMHSTSCGVRWGWETSEVWELACSGADSRELSVHTGGCTSVNEWWRRGVVGVMLEGGGGAWAVARGA